MWWVELLNSIVALLESGAGGGGGAYESIATATGTGSSGIITLSSIPSTYKHLQLRIAFLTSADNYESIAMQFNNDTGNNYARHRLSGDGSSASAAANSSFSSIWVSDVMRGADNTRPSVAIVDIHDYSVTTKNTTVRTFAGTDKNGSGGIDLMSGLWNNTAAVSTIKLSLGSDVFTTSSVVSLYGIRGA